MVWGIDLGVRSLYVARLEGASLELFSHHSLRIHKQPRDEELKTLHQWLADLIREGEVWVEEPPLAGARNLQVFLHLSQVSAVAGLVGQHAVFVPVSSWKHGTVGNGSASKDLVARWLRRRHPGYAQACSGDQNYVDATCLALYGKAMGTG